MGWIELGTILAALLWSKLSDRKRARIADVRAWAKIAYSIAPDAWKAELEQRARSAGVRLTDELWDVAGDVAGALAAAEQSQSDRMLERLKRLRPPPLP
jgi:hypothetical protein